MKTIHFISGMPRSGSTLLCNILAQNPRLHCTHTSGCMDVLFGVRNQWDKLVEHQAHPNPGVKLNVLKAILDAYYADMEKPVILDKSRGWLAHLEMAEAIIGRKAKVIVPVRRLEEIVASMEQLHRKTAATQQPPGEAELYFQMQTTEGRCDYWNSGQGVIGLAFNRIKDAMQRGFRDRLHFVDYERLCANPAETLSGIYEFLGEEQFIHDFNNVEQVTQEDDAVHGYAGLHTIRPQVSIKPRSAGLILGAPLRKKYSDVPLPWEN